MYRELFQALPNKHKAFLYLVALQAVYVFVERIFVLVSTINDEDGANKEAKVWFFCVIVISMAYVAYLAFHAVLHSNAFELGAFLIASLMLAVRLTLEFTTRSDTCDSKVLCISMLAAAATFNVIHWIMCIRMASDLKWRKYKAIGADVVTRQVYLRYEQFSAVRKLDMQFSMILMVTGLVFFSSNTSDSVAGLIPTIILFFVELGWDAIGVKGVKQESMAFMKLFWGLSVMTPAFVVFVLIESLSTSKLFNQIKDNEEKETIAFFAALYLLNRIATVVGSVVLCRQFGPRYVGLRRILADRSWLFKRNRLKEGDVGAGQSSVQMQPVSSSKKKKKKRRVYRGCGRCEPRHPPHPARRAHHRHGGTC